MPHKISILVVTMTATAASKFITCPLLGLLSSELTYDPNVFTVHSRRSFTYPASSYLFYLVWICHECDLFTQLNFAPFSLDP